MKTVVIDKPIDWFRRTIIEANRQDYPYYHRRFNRVRTVDECHKDDDVCVYEANIQFKRDKKVAAQIIKILTQRYEQCAFERGGIVDMEPCYHLEYDLRAAITGYNVQFGDLGIQDNAINAYFKQKHRMLWERKHPDQDIYGLPTREEYVKQKVGKLAEKQKQMPKML
ncbi:hypothetical protein SNEBB_000861 [Seison nebaliae]|nr:hypothetical protein SNEBB_000861 [Seison nebaliae]